MIKSSTVADPNNRIIGRGPTPMGPVEVVISDLGLQTVRFIDDHDGDREPTPEAEAPIARAIAWVSAAIDGRPIDEAWRLPLDWQGSSFQIEVWEALGQVPRGTSTTYAELATRIGRNPSAARAVARACAANPIAVLIPCHRVVRGNGDLGGYRWGLDRKKQLLEREGALPHRPGS